MEQNYPRNNFNDAIKGVAVLLMIFFHLCFDLNLYGLIKVDILNHPFWYFLPRLIVFLFFFSVGFSLLTVHHSKIKWSLFFRRQLKLFVLSLLISVITYVTFPQNWIYFGTLHCIFFNSFLLLFFCLKPEKTKYLALILGLLLFIMSALFKIDLPFFKLDHASFDYISPFPWIGASLLGLFCKEWLDHLSNKSFPLGHIFHQNHHFMLGLTYLGRHSLLIYLGHQLVLMSLVYIIKKLIF